MIKRRLGFGALALSLALGLNIDAALAQPPGDGPPPEALAACRAKAPNDPCQANLRGGAITGACWAPPGRPLACRPHGAPAGPPGRQGPPPEALAACASKKAADPCDLRTQHGTQQGLCEGPAQHPLACRPKGAPPPPPR
jgi:hypothetical protein